VSAPQLAHERVRVGEAHASFGLATDVRDRLQRLDRVLAQKAREGAVRARLRIEKDPRRRPVEEREAPAVRVRARGAAAPREPGEAEHDVRRGVAVHPE
jgi:hypothetical protein